jgi:beta-fructofuranosidase
VTDRLTPRLHVRPASGWLNDPNGPVRWAGRYHLFFQHHPAAPVPGLRHWGHASSADLVQWRSEPVALTPTPGGPDAGGCWSGCVVDDNGIPTAVYTGLRDADPRSGAICLARGEDELRMWVGEPVPVVPGPPPGLAAVGFRDPFVFSTAGHRWAIVGAGLPDGPAALLYRCDDLRSWEYAGSLVGPDATARSLAPADIWECPQLFPAGDRAVLITSRWTGGTLGPVSYLAGNLIPTAAGDAGPGLRFLPTGGGRVDLGGDFYAPAVLVEPTRTLLWGWSRESRSPAEVAAAGWAGVLTLPRVVGLTPDGRLASAPAPELSALRRSPPMLAEEVALVAGDLVNLAVLPARADIVADVRTGTGRVELGLLESPAGHRLTIGLAPATGDLTVDRTGWPAVPSRAAVQREHGTPADGPVTVRVLLDGPVVEIFVGEDVAVTERVYPRHDDRAVLSLACTAGRAEVSITCWEAALPGRP